MLRPVGNQLNILLLGQAGAGKTTLFQSVLNCSDGRSIGLNGTLRPILLEQGKNPRFQYSPSSSSPLVVNLPIEFAEWDLSAEGGRFGEEQLSHADGLIVVVDASLQDESLQKAFDAAVEVIDRVQDRQRAQFRSAGFPVFVALTKCDLLADNLMDRDYWLAKVESRRKELKDLFLDVYAVSGKAGFGSLVFDIRPVAVKRPDTTDKQQNRDEPFGVATLFRDMIQLAHAHAERQRESNGRLSRLLLGLTTVLTMFVCLGLGLYALQPADVQLALEAKVDAYQSRDGQTASTRLAAGQLNRKRSELLEFKNDPEFERLPQDKRAYVQTQLDEIEAYSQLRDDFARLPQPTKTRSLEDLSRLEDSLKALAIPTAHEKDWAQTEVAQSKERYLQEIPLLRSAVGEARQFFARLKNRANELLFVSELLPDWDLELQKLEREAAKPLFSATDRLKMASLDFREVDSLRGEWTRSQDRLRVLRDLATALGMIGNPMDGKAVLLLTEVDLESADPLHLIAERLSALKRVLPGYENWSTTMIPDGLRPQFLSRLNRAVALSIQLGQKLLLQQMLMLNPTGPEKASDWPRVGEWLLSPPAKSYREFQAILSRLRDPESPDACDYFARFAATKSFNLSPKSLRLFIPDQLHEYRLRPDGKLTIRHQQGTDKTKFQSYPFKMDGEGIRDKNGMSYLFLAEGGVSILFTPGDPISADLPLKEGEKNFQFSWIRSRTASFQFERLLREPRLHNPALGATTGDWAEGVKMTVTEGSIPNVPDLLPTVRWP